MPNITFLSENGAHRMRNYAEQRILIDGSSGTTDEPKNQVDVGYECPQETWKPIPVGDPCSHRDWEHRPQLFVDGKDAGRIVAWTRTREGHPVPVRLSQIGAIAMREEDGCLMRDFQVVERVVTMLVDPFPWDQVEEFAAQLREHGFRLLPSQRDDDTPSYDFEVMRKNAESRSIDEMFRLERLAVARGEGVPTLVDGRLQKHVIKDDLPVVGLIKSNWRNYLHPEGWKVFYDLQPRQRTPAFQMENSAMSIVSWYLRMDGKMSDLPNWGVVRVEIGRTFFEKQMGKDAEYLTRLSQLICDYKCRDESYGRASVSIYPIQRGEESLGSLFTDRDGLVSKFYHLTGL
jgi:hypothetical protein